MRIPLLLCLVSVLAQGLEGQTTSVPNSGARKLAYVVPGLIEDLIESVPALYRPFLQGSITSDLASVNSSLSAQLSNLPVPSPASGYRYTFDPSLGVYVRTVQSLGPVLTERAETLGRNRFFFAVTHQRYSFDRIDDIDLRGFHVDLPVSLLGSPALATADTLVHLTVSQTTAHFTYGLAHNIDLSYAVPVIRSHITVSTQSGVKSLLNGQPIITLPRRWVQQSATGLGDSLLRLKIKLAGAERLGVAVATDLRLPTGDELNYHGAGAYGVKPFMALSWQTRRLSPHINAGFQWNGSSFLASSAANRKERLPSQVFYAVGFDAGITPKITLAFDLFDQWIHKGQRTFIENFDEIDGNSYQRLRFPHESRHEYNAAVGIKAALPRDVILTWNLMFRLNQAGLRARVIPMLGASFVF